jgi:hypothetical protein
MKTPPLTSPLTPPLTPPLDSPLCSLATSPIVALLLVLRLLLPRLLLRLLTSLLLIGPGLGLDRRDTPKLLAIIAEFLHVRVGVDLRVRVDHDGVPARRELDLDAGSARSSLAGAGGRGSRAREGAGARAAQLHGLQDPLVLVQDPSKDAHLLIVRGGSTLAPGRSAAAAGGGPVAGGGDVLAGTGVGAGLDGASDELLLVGILFVWSAKVTLSDLVPGRTHVVLLLIIHHLSRIRLQVAGASRG